MHLIFSKPTRVLAALITAMCCVLIIGESSAAPAKVFLLAGQSNMEGYGDNSDLTGSLASPLSTVQIWKSGTSSFADLAPGYGVGGGSNGSGSYFGPELVFGHELAGALPGKEIVLIKYAVSATDLENDWEPSTNGTYTAFKNTVTNALTALGTPGVDYQIEALLWSQGERDARQGFGPNYESNLNAFIADVRLQYGSDLPFLLSQLSSGQTDLPVLGLSQVRTAQANVAGNDPNAYLIATDSFALDHDVDLHFGTNGQLALGEAFADQYLAIVPEPGSLLILTLGAMALSGRKKTG